MSSVLDLGSGTGICAVIASRVLGASWTFATDLPEHIVGILGDNVKANRSVGAIRPARDLVESEQQTAELGESAIRKCDEASSLHLNTIHLDQSRPEPPLLTALPLDWLKPIKSTLIPFLPMDIILASDCIFSMALLPAFFSTLSSLSGPRTIAYLALEPRDPKVVEEAWKEAERRGFGVKRIGKDKVANRTQEYIKRLERFKPVPAVITLLGEEQQLVLQPFARAIFTASVIKKAPEPAEVTGAVRSATSIARNINDSRAFTASFIDGQSRTYGAGAILSVIAASGMLSSTVSATKTRTQSARQISSFELSCSWLVRMLEPSPNSIANLGQLAVDLIVSTFNLQLVGWIRQNSDILLPLAGIDPLGRGPQGSKQTLDVAGETEVYYSSDLRLTVLQLRSAVIKGRHLLFSSSLASWIRRSGFQSVLILAGADATRRTDGEISAGLIRSVTPPLVMSTGSGDSSTQLLIRSRSLGISSLQLSSESSQKADPSPLPGSGPMLKIMEELSRREAKQGAVEVMGLVGYTVEGDNLSDSLLLTSAALSILSLPTSSGSEAMKEEIVFTLLELVSGLRLGVNVAQSMLSVAFSASKAATALGFAVAQNVLEGGNSVKRIEGGDDPAPDLPHRILASLLHAASEVSRASISAVDASFAASLGLTSWALKHVDELIISGSLLTPTRAQTGLFRLLAKFLDMVETDRAVLETGAPEASVLQKVTAFRTLLVLQKQSRHRRYRDLPSVERVDLAVLRAVTLEQWVADENFPDAAPTAEPPEEWYDALDETRTIITFVSHQKSFDLVSAEVSSQIAAAQKRASVLFDSKYSNFRDYAPSPDPAPVPSPYVLREINPDEEYSAFLHRCASYALAAYGRRYRWIFHLIAGESPADTQNDGEENKAGTSRRVVDVDPEHVLMASRLADVAPKLAKAADEASRAPAETGKETSTSTKPSEPRHPLAYHPTYLLLVDHPTRSIILVLRGTLSLHDLLVDLNSGSVPFPIRHSSSNSLDDDVIMVDADEPYLSESFLVHQGMLEAAQILADPQGPVMAELANAMKAWSEYGVVLVGHSLGAGVAACLAGLLADPATSLTLPNTPPLPGNRPLHCICFGPPALVSLPLSHLLRGVPSTHPSGRPRPAFVTSVVVGHDPIPRLCVDAIADTARRIGSVLDSPTLSSEALHRARGSAERSEAGADTGEWFHAQYREVCERARSRVGGSSTNTSARRVYPPGRVLWLRPLATGGAGYAMYDVGDVAEVFGEVEWSAEGMWEHTPGVYERAVAAATGGS
ncbi:hypothetical protein HDU93_000154 [Gonapodya sp. JEL0774]|nr:hypothetical protein HDU93_000154 [Gonapodya sp. JEL0774]